MRRNTAHGVRDGAATQRQTIVRTTIVAARRPAVREERRVEEIAGEVAGERASGAIGTSQTRRETNNEEFRVSRSEARDRRVEPAGLPFTSVVTKCDEPRAEGAIVARIKRGRRQNDLDLRLGFAQRSTA